MEQTTTSEPRAETLSVAARTYFLQQGQRIQKLHSLLDSNLLTGIAKSGISILLEVVLFLIGLGGIALAVYLPTYLSGEMPINERTHADVSLTNEDLRNGMLILKAAIVLLSLIPLALMTVLKRNRHKRALIAEAYLEVDDMKMDFDKAVKELRF
jgi:hypothetical protein